MATRKKPAASAAKTKTTAKQKQTVMSGLDRRWGILYFGIGIIFIMLVLIPGESGWAWMRTNLLFGTFGISSWLIGPMVVYWGVLVSMEKPLTRAVIKCVLFLFAISGVALVFSEADFAGLSFGETLAALHANGKAGAFSGGLISVLFGWSLLALTGRVVARLLMVLIFIVSLMFFTNTTPAEVVDFVLDLWEKRPRKEEGEYQEPYADKGVQAAVKQPVARATAGAMASPPPPAAKAGKSGYFGGNSSKKRRRGLAVDIDLGPDELPSQPGLGESDDVVVGPGGTFGQNPLAQSFADHSEDDFGMPDDGPILPFAGILKANANPNPFEREGGADILLFGKDDPMANLGGTNSLLPRNTLLDIEMIGPVEPAAAPGFDLFGGTASGGNNTGFATPTMPPADGPGMDIYARRRQTAAQNEMVEEQAGIANGSQAKLDIFGNPIAPRAVEKKVTYDLFGIPILTPVTPEPGTAEAQPVLDSSEKETGLGDDFDLFGQDGFFSKADLAEEDAPVYQNQGNNEGIGQPDIFAEEGEYSVPKITEEKWAAQATGLGNGKPAGVFAGEVPPAGAESPVNGSSGTEFTAVDEMIDRAATRQETHIVAPLVTSTELKPYEMPPLSLFIPAKAESNEGAREEMKKTADLLVSTLASFGVQTRILDVSRGPSVTRYEVQPQAGVKISRITNLADDIALNLAAAGVRIEAPIPGKPAVGIEVPNKIKSTVSIRNLLETTAFVGSDSPLSIALGKDIAGECVVADLTKMPHLLIAGSTGSGKSVCVNATIMSFLYKSSPEDVKLLLIDPKVVELAEYNGIPHLLMPVVTEPRKAAGALGSAVAEMERRYRLFAENNVREIRTFNKLAARKEGELEKLPYIAIVIDELADLMMTSGKEVEDYICRIAQKARAAGMHLIVATQRPSVDVITGLIKANIPSRIAFAVSSQVDSRTILDGGGAEKLLGMGDMLFMPVGANKPVRVQGTYVQDKEISAVLQHIKRECGAEYDEEMIEEMERRASPEAVDGGGNGDGDDIIQDPTFISAVETALEMGQISTSFLQRRLRLGYARAGRLMDEMERLNIVTPPEGSKPRQVLINRQEWLEMSMNHREE